MWGIRICTKQGDRLSTQELRGFDTKRKAFAEAMTHKKTGHSPIYKDGHTYIVFTN